MPSPGHCRNCLYDRRDGELQKFRDAKLLWIITHGKKASDGLFEWRRRHRTQGTHSNKLVLYLLLPWWCTHPEDTISCRVWQQSGIFLWLMLCLFGAVGMPSPPPSQQRPHSVFPGPDWSGLMLSCFPKPQSPVCSEPANSQIMLCPVQHPSLQLSAPLHITLIPEYFYILASFFTLPQNQVRRDNSTPPKEIWLESCTTSLNMINLFLQEPVGMSQSWFKDVCGQTSQCSKGLLGAEGVKEVGGI